MTEVVLGIDVGTSGVRIVAQSRAGEAMAMAQAAMVLPTAEFGRALQDPWVWWQALEQAFARLDLKGLQVLALAIDGTSGTIVPVDENGMPLELGSMYNDNCEAVFLNRIRSVAPSETAALGSTSPLARAMNMPSGRILHQADWLAGLLSGNFSISDENNSLKTGYDPVTRTWPAWIANAGFDIERLPKVVAAGTQTGTLLKEKAEHLGLPNNVAVVAGTTDGCAAFLASGASEPGDGVTSLGTTLTLKLLSAFPVFAPQFGIYSHRIGDQWLAGGASNSGGAVLAQHFSAEQIVKLSMLIDPSVSSGLDYYPLPKPGERFPVNDAAFVPRLTPRPPEDHLFLHGLLEGIARIECLAYGKLVELGASRLASIRTVGGGAANAAWSTMRLRMLGVDAKPVISEHAAMGAARLAWRGIGYHA